MLTFKVTWVTPNGSTVSRFVVGGYAVLVLVADITANKGRLLSKRAIVTEKAISYPSGTLYI